MRRVVDRPEQDEPRRRRGHVHEQLRPGHLADLGPLGPEELVFEFGTFAVPVLELDRVGASNSGSGRDVASMIILGDLSVEISFDAFTLYWQLQTPSVTALRILVFRQVDNCPTAILLPLTKNQLVRIGVDGHKLLRLAWLVVMTSSVLR